MAKNLENVLNILGSGLNLGGKLLFGLDGDTNLGEPLQMLGGHLAKKRQDKSLMDILNGVGTEIPEAAPLIQGAMSLAQNGGILGRGSGAMGETPSGEPVTQAIGQQPPQPSGAAPTAQESIASMMSGPITANSDFSSPDFIRRLATGGREDLAEYALKQKLQGNSAMEDLRTMMLGQQLTTMETPQQKTARDIAASNEKAQFADELAGNRQSAQKAEMASHLKPGEIDDLGKQESVLGLLQTISDIVPKNAQALALLDKVPVIGPAVISKVDPGFAAAKKQLLDIKGQIATSRGGKALTQLEASLTLGTMPEYLEDPKFFPVLKRNVIARTQFANYASMDSLQKGGRDVSSYISPEKLARFRDFRGALQKHGQKIFEVPEVQAAMAELGLDGFILPKKPNGNSPRPSK